MKKNILSPLFIFPLALSLFASARAENSKDDQLDMALVEAMEHQDMAAVTRLLNEGAPVNPTSTNPEVQPPLLVAAGLGNSTDLVALLIDKGADVNAADKQGVTPLIEALAGTPAPPHRAEIVKLLIDKGAKIDAKDQQGFTAAWHAAWAGSEPDILQTLIDKGADIKSVNPDYGTILHYTGAFAPDPNPSAEGKAKGDEALRRTVDILIKAGVDVNAKNRQGETALIKFADFGEDTLVDALLAHGVNVNAADDLGRTALLDALLPSFAAPPNVAMVYQLLAHGADATIGTNNPQGKSFAPSPLKAAIIGGRYYANSDQKARRAMLKKLLDKGAMFACAKGSDTEALLDAASLGDVAGVRALLAKGVKADAADDRGWTPLMSAVGLGYNDVADLLLASGANVNARDASSFTALWLEVSCGADPLRVDVLLGHKADPGIAAAGYYGPIINRAVLRKDVKILEALLNAGADANQGITDSGGNSTTPLETAVHHQQTEMVKLLLAHKADPNPKSNEDRSPLYWAIGYKNVEMVEALLAAGAKLDAVSVYHETIQQQAQRSENAEIAGLVSKAAAGK